MRPSSFSFYLASKRLPAIGTHLCGEVAGGFGSSDWLTHTLLAVSLARTLYDRQAICQTAEA